MLLLLSLSLLKIKACVVFKNVQFKNRVSQSFKGKDRSCELYTQVSANDCNYIFIVEYQNQ
jgi:hypothetical protein